MNCSLDLILNPLNLYNSPQRSVERRRQIHRIAGLIQADRQIITFQRDRHSIPCATHSRFQDATARRRYVCTAGGRRGTRRGARRRTGCRWSGHHGACMARGLHHHRIRFEVFEESMTQFDIWNYGRLWIYTCRHFSVAYCSALACVGAHIVIVFLYVFRERENSSLLKLENGWIYNRNPKKKSLIGTSSVRVVCSVHFQLSLMVAE